MGLIKGLIVVAIMYTLCNFLLLKSVRALKENQSFRKIRKAGMLAAIQCMRDFALIATVTYLALIAILLYLNVAGRALTAEEATAAINKLAHYYSLLKGFKDFWATFLWIACTAILALLVWRSRRNYLRDAVNTAVRTEVERLRAKRATNPKEWADLEPTPEMLKLLARVRDLVAAVDDPQVPKSPARRNQLASEATRLLNLYESLDLQRRMKLDWKFDYPDPKGFWGKSRRLLLSRGLLQDLRTFAKIQGYAASAMISVLLLSFGAGILSARAGDRLLQLRDLQIELSVNAAAQSRKQAEGRARQSKSDTPTISFAQASEDTRYIARVFEESFSQNPIWLDATHQRSSGAELRREAVRVVLQESTADRDTAKDTFSARLFDAGLPNSVAGFLSDSSLSSSDPEPRTALGRAFFKDLRGHSVYQLDAVRQKLRSAVSAHRSAYGEFIGAAKLQDWIVGDVIGRVLDGVLPVPHTLSADQGMKAVKKFGQDAVKNAYSIARDRFLMALLTGGSLADAARLVRSSDGPSPLMRDSDVAECREFVAGETRWYELVPDLQRVRTPAEYKHALAEIDLKQLEAINRLHDSMRSLAEVSARTYDDSDIDSLASDYQQEFPDRFDSREAIRFRLLREWGIGESTIKDLEEESARRSFDYKLLQVYGHQGGIAFGRDPSQSSVLDFREFSFSPNGKSVAFVLKRSDGKIFRFGPFGSELVNRVLSYVADRRLSVVTIVSGGRTSRELVLLHPAFEDSVIGEHIIEADKWIFKITDSAENTFADSRGVRRWLDSTEAQVGIYDELISGLERGSIDTRVISEWGDRVSHDVASPLPTYPSLFEPKLVRPIELCEQRTSGTFVNCIVDRLRAFTGQSISPPPKVLTGFASQVGETPYSLDPELHFMSGEDGYPAWPLEMRVHMTLNDKQEFRMPEVTPPIAEQVRSNLTATHHYGSFAEIRDLVVLQRFFRAILSGKFGAAFPIERLLELADSTREFRTYAKTSRWEFPPKGEPSLFEVAVRTNAINLAKEINKASLHSTPMLQSAATRLTKCAEVLRSTTRPDLLPETQWHDACGFTVMLHNLAREEEDKSPQLAESIEFTARVIETGTEIRHTRVVLHAQ